MKSLHNKLALDIIFAAHDLAGCDLASSTHRAEPCVVTPRLHPVGYSEVANLNDPR